jgi:hypothetical protein
MTLAARAARLAALAFALAAPAACDRFVTSFGGGAGPEAGLLRGKAPVESHAVTHVLRLTDGIAASAGDPSRTDLTASLALSGYVTWDLGAAIPIRCALIDADGDGSFMLSISNDGWAFEELWTAGRDEDRGQQLRAGRGLRGAGRYLRLSGVGNHGPVSVSELSAWRDCPTRWPPLAMQKGTPDDEAVRLKLWAFAALAVTYVLTYRKRAPDWMKLLGAVPAGVGVALAVQVAENWPPSGQLLARLLGVGAAVVVAVGLRWLVGRKRSPSF